MIKTPQPPTSGERYRKRAAGVTKRLKGHSISGADRSALNKKRKALSDMADNEDWLDGKIKAKD